MRIKTDNKKTLKRMSAFVKPIKDYFFLAGNLTLSFT